MKSKLIVFEGADSCGKGTQSTLLAEVLGVRGLKCIRVEPTKSSHPLGKRYIYGMLASGAAKRHPTMFQLVQFANRMYFQFCKLPKLRREHDVVILDRWALSGFVYGHAENIDPLLNSVMFKLCVEPDLTLVMTGKSYRREASDDSYEKDSILQSRVKTAYRNIAQGRKNVAAIDNHDPIPNVLANIVALLERKGVV